jgi:hypothetical protein
MNSEDTSLKTELEGRAITARYEKSVLISSRWYAATSTLPRLPAHCNLRAVTHKPSGAEEGRKLLADAVAAYRSALEMGQDPKRFRLVCHIGMQYIGLYIDFS